MFRSIDITMWPRYWVDCLCRKLIRVPHTALIVLIVLAAWFYLTMTAYILYSNATFSLSLRAAPSASRLEAQEAMDSPSQVSTACKEKVNFVFIKGMKCATSTLLGVFYHFGYTRNLSFVSPLGNRLYINWPFPMTKLDFRPSSRGYNILTDHAVFTESVMAEIMPADTVYISIVRNPMAQLASIFQYFKIHWVAKVPRDVVNPVVEYFTHLEKYEANYLSPTNKERHSCYPAGFSMTRNLMSHCHGMPLGFPSGTNDISNDTAAVDRYLKYLDTKFSLIMIVEHFYESIILLRRLMCWAFKDVLFIRSNVAKYDFDVTKIGQHVTDLHHNWSNIDYRLYAYFNRTLWKRISEQGPKFSEEVSEFKSVQTQVNSYCQSIYQLGKMSEYPANMSELVVPASPWTEQFSVSPDDCWMLGPDPYQLLHNVQKENDVKESALLEAMKNITDNRPHNLKSIC